MFFCCFSFLKLKKKSQVKSYITYSVAMLRHFSLEWHSLAGGLALQLVGKQKTENAGAPRVSLWSAQADGDTGDRRHEERSTGETPWSRTIGRTMLFFQLP